MGGATAVRLVPAEAVDAAALAQCFNASFAGYIGGTMPPLDAAGIADFMARQGASPGMSRVAIDQQARPLGFAFIGRRVEADGMRSRVGGMGVVPQRRGQGLAARLLDIAIADASERGDAQIELEVIAQNLPAWRLYRSRGFAEAMALHGYACEALALDGEAAIPPPPPRELSLAEAAAWLAGRGADLPFQQSHHVLPTMKAAQTRSWQLGPALLVFQEPSADGGVALRLVHADERIGGADAALGELLAALGRAHPGRSLRLPALLAPRYGGRALARLGLRRQALYQQLMRRPVRLP